MAKVRMFQIEERGSLGEVTFRNVDGDMFVQKKSSLDKDKMLSNKAFAKTLKLNSEFAAVSALTKELMLSHNGMEKSVPGAKHYRKWVFSRLMLIKGMDKEHRVGESSLMVSQYGDMLTRKSWGSRKVDTTLMKRPTLSVGDGKSVTLTLPELDITNVNAPKGASHMKLTLLMMGMSDKVYSTDTKLFESVNESAEGYSVMTESDYIDLSQPLETPISLNVKPDLTTTEGAAFIVVVGVTFYQYRAGGYDLMRSGSAFENVMAL